MRNAIVLILLAITAPAMSYTVTLAYDGIGSGTTVLIPSGPYTAGTVVTAIALPDEGSFFDMFDQPNPFTVNGDMTLTTTFGIIDCIHILSPMYADWLGDGKNWRKPNCWCYERQCRGDTDNVKNGLFWVAAPDLATFISAYTKGDAKLEPAMICADLDHKKVGLFRVQASDLAIFIAHYTKGSLKVPVCPMDWDGDGDDDYNFWITP